nr:MAG TPA: hypothetical protein [Caudoviricetes sp.]
MNWVEFQDPDRAIKRAIIRIYIYRNDRPESVKDCRGKGVESLILLHNLSLFLNPWRNVKEEKGNEQD